MRERPKPPISYSTNKASISTLGPHSISGKAAHNRHLARVFSPSATIAYGGHMLYTFTLHEDAWLRDGPVYAGGPVIGYRVGGMPDGRTARIANFGAPNANDWRIMRINVDNTQT